MLWNNRGIPHTRNEDIPVMGHEVLKDGLWAVDNIHISPVNPRMIRLQGGVEQIVTCPANSLTARTLSGKGVSILNVHVHIGPEVLLDNARTAERNLVALFLDPIQLRDEEAFGVILGVADEEGQVDKVMRIGQLVEELEVLLQIWASISQRRQDEHSFSVCDSLSTRADGVEVNVVNGRRVDFIRVMVVIDDRGLHMGIPFGHFVKTHIHWRLGRSVTVETGRSS